MQRRVSGCSPARIVAVLAFVLVSICCHPVAEAEEYPHHPVNLSLFYPISTNQNPDVSTYCRLNLIYGDIGAVRGVDLNGIVGRTRRDMTGVQFTGLYSHIEGELAGVAVSGIANYVQSDALGFQYSGMVNFVRGDFTGFQFANLFNYVEGDVLGAQTTALFNLNDGDVKYWQYSTALQPPGKKAEPVGRPLWPSMPFLRRPVWLRRCRAGTKNTCRAEGGSEGPG